MKKKLARMSSAKEDAGALLDALYLDMLDLIEQQTMCRVNIERLSNSGQLLLAKTRYVQGSQTVSIAQIPTENSTDFKALCRVHNRPNENKVALVDFQLQRQEINKEESYVEPLHWFGVLTPSSLRLATEQFKKCIQLVVESANVQCELSAVIKSISRLRKILYN